MSYKLSQLPPLSTSRANLRVSIPGPLNTGPLDYHDLEFSRSWLTYDSEGEKDREPRRLKRNLILGIILVLGISAGFWAGVAYVIAHVWK